jgi:multimeric flavodoxin WrbA
MTEKVRTGQAPPPLDEAAFRERFGAAFADPTFVQEAGLLDRVATVAWKNYRAGRKAPVTRPAGKGFADPTYQLSVEWSGTRGRLLRADALQRRPGTPSRVLVVAGAARNDGSCPGEMSKTFRLATIVADTLRRQRITPDLLDLSLLTSDYRRYIHPCKGCVSTAMPLCHWPCSCYPNHATGQTGDWMAEIYERWVAAHGVIIVTPVYWYQAPSVLKLMMDRLVCADGGNPDPTSTSGKDAAKAKQLELDGWPYPKHLAGRVYGVVVHGDVAGIEGLRRSLCDWLDWMGLVDAGNVARLDRYVGYYEPYASSHRSLDADEAVQEEVRNVARAVAVAVGLSRAGKLARPGRKLVSPRSK